MEPTGCDELVYTRLKIITAIDLYCRRNPRDQLREIDPELKVHLGWYAVEPGPVEDHPNESTTVWSASLDLSARSLNS